MLWIIQKSSYKQARTWVSEKTKYMITSHQQNINLVQNQNTVIENLSFEKVEKFKYLEVTVTNMNNISKEIKHRINMGNACYYSLEKILSSRLPSKKLKVKAYDTIILPVVLYGCETWSLTFRGEHRLRVFENKVLRKIYGAKKDEITGEWRKLLNAELHALYSSSNIIRNHRGGPVVIILATGSEVRGFKPGLGRWIFFRA